MKNKIIPWLQYCLECGSKNKRIKTIFIDSSKYRKKSKHYRNKYTIKNNVCTKQFRKESNIKIYRCLKCENSEITYSKATNLNNLFYINSLNILTPTLGGFRYRANKSVKCLYSYRFKKEYFPKDEVEAFKIVQRLISNSIFQ